MMSKSKLCNTKEVRELARSVCLARQNLITFNHRLTFAHYALRGANIVADEYEKQGVNRVSFCLLMPCCILSSSLAYIFLHESDASFDVSYFFFDGSLIITNSKRFYA